MECDEAVPFAGVDCGGYRLPTEAEWEYAARAGTITRFWSGDADADLDGVDWHFGTSAIDGFRQSHPVGQLRVNPWGLYDVHGNVGEWVHDRYGDYDAGDQQDPVTMGESQFRVFRGGHFVTSPLTMRSASRARHPPDTREVVVGFRVARSPR